MVLQSIEPSDEALALRVADGDMGAFATLYDRHATRVYAWAAQLLGADEADDVTQEVFMRLWHKAPQFDPARGRFAAWFVAVARHAIAARGRKRSLESRIIAVEEIGDLLASAPDPRPSVEALVWTAERDAALAAAVRDLPAEQRRVIVMAYFGGLSQSEIAKAVATPLGTVKQRTRLALAKLRRAVAEHGSARAGSG
jgi:RNA polymerase sigma-70 factor, ECF subfamily